MSSMCLSIVNLDALQILYLPGISWCVQFLLH